MRAWHRDMMAGLTITIPDEIGLAASAFVGNFRGPPDLPDVCAHVGSLSCVKPESITAELTRFEATLQRLINTLDTHIPPGVAPHDEALFTVVRVCGWAHAEWIRIHPFGNGNGRTARLLANSIAMRYAMAPFVTLRPRPTSDAYLAAGRAAVRGNPKPTCRLFLTLFTQHMQRWSDGSM